MLKSAEKENIILGIDPGTSVMGYGLISCKKNKILLIQYGVIHLAKYKNHEIRLQKIFQRVDELIQDYFPDEVALEAPFYGKNVQSMLKLGRAQGVAMAAALMKNIPIFEYAPKKIKKVVTGNGNASKEQVAAMLKQQLNFKEIPKLLDATDALGVAICHYFSQHSAMKSNANNSWESFIKENPKRLR